jgi:RimJ/RimL family protein N-acetyltransferase
MFTGEFVRLGAMLPEHYTTLLEWDDLLEIQRLADDEPIRPHTPAQRDEEYRRFQKDTVFAFSLFRLTDDQLIGSCVLAHVDPRSRSAGLGIVISAPGAAGQGCGTDALRLLAAYAFDELNLNRLELEVFDFNAPAIRAYEKAGFQTEVVKREALYREGKFHHVYVMSLLRSEWADRVKK